MTEQWKPIPGFEERYEVSDQGRVRSLVSGRVLTPNDNGRGYLQAHLYAGGRHTRSVALVHRLVAKAFLPPPESEKDEVNHKDFDKSHNAVKNLEWCCHQSNVDHALAAGRQPDKRLAVVGVSFTGQKIRFESQVAAEEYFRGKRTGLISRHLSGKSGSAYGYYWSLA